MSFQDPRNVPLVLGLLVGCLGYLACIVLSPPVLAYLPEIEQWSFGAPPKDLIAMRYFGMPQWGLGGFVLGFLLARVRPIGDALARGAQWLARLAAIVVVGTLVYVLVKELAHWGSI